MGGGVLGYVTRLMGYVGGRGIWIEMAIGFKHDTIKLNVLFVDLFFTMYDMVFPPFFYSLPILVYWHLCFFFLLNLLYGLL